MDRLTTNDVKQLSDQSANFCVSIYLPTHTAGRDTEQDPIRFKNLLKEAEERLLSNGLRAPEVEAILAAFHGRIDTVFVPIGVQVWGQIDQDAGAVSIHVERMPGDVDFLDLAAIQTLTNGGNVFVVRQEQMPVPASVAAILRY